jgi:FMN phosphatase YigB (HAD superfamily)
MRHYLLRRHGAADCRDGGNDAVGALGQHFPKGVSAQLGDGLFLELALADLTGAADLFHSIFARTEGVDGDAFPGALEVLQRLRGLGPTVILSDGDVVFQPRKVARAGLSAAVDGHVLIYIHKEEALDDVERRYPADHYVLVDDKLRILAAVKQFWGERVTTVFPRQGIFAHDPDVISAYPPADVTIERIADLLDCALPRPRTPTQPTR